MIKQTTIVVIGALRVNGESKYDHFPLISLTSQFRNNNKMAAPSI